MQNINHFGCYDTDIVNHFISLLAVMINNTGKYIIARGWAVDRVHNSRRPLDRLF